MGTQIEKSMEHEMAHVIPWWCIGLGTSTHKFSGVSTTRSVVFRFVPWPRVATNEMF